MAALNSWAVLIMFLIVCLGAAVPGAVWAANSTGAWYLHLRKPALSPSKRVFVVAWPTLNCVMAVGAWLVWREAGWEGGKAAFFLFFVQLALVPVWPRFLFELHRPAMALVWVHILLVAVTAVAVVFHVFSTAAFWLLMPQTVWTCFSTYFVFRLWQLNSAPAV